jgi:hypothetical protein
MRERLLIRHFLWRFLEHDLVSPNADRREVLSAVGGALIAVSLFLAALLALQYQFDNFMPPGIASLLSLDDRFLFTSASMLVMALAGVVQWDALVLDARDTAVLGPLPIPKAVIVRAKFVATALFASSVVLAWNLFPTLLSAAAVPLKLPIGLGGALRLTLAQGVATIGAGVFGFLTVLGLREVVSALLGPTHFRKISAVLQASLVAVLTTALLLLPFTSRDVARGWLARGGLTAKALPSLWFVGLHEALAGSVVDNLPRTEPQIFLRVPERDATALYRSLWPLYHELAVIAVVAFVLVTLVTILACIWNNRRLPTTSGRPASRNGALSRGWNWIVVHVVARTSLRQAGFFFTLQTLSRRVSHRVAMAASLAIGLSLVVLNVGGVLATGNDSGSIPVALLAAQPLLIACVLCGFRHATRVPAELRASSTFSLALVGNSTPYISGVKRAGWLAVVAPTLLALTIWDTAILGPHVALLHVGVGLSLSALLLDTLFVRYRRVPFVSGYVPSVDVKLTGVVFLASVLSGSFALAWVERGSLETATGYVALLTILLGLSVGVRAFDRASRGPAAVLDLDEQPALPTQRLNLQSDGK